MTRRPLLVSALLIAACDYAPLAPVSDAAADVATLDAPPDTPPLPANHVHFVVDKVNVPANNTQARTYGLDLNGDAIIDNQLGMVIGTLAGMGLDSQTEMDRAIDAGAATMLADLGTDDVMTEPLATFTMWQGAMPVPAACTSAADTVCRKHLTGSGAFSIKSGAPVDPPLQGAIAGGKLTAGPGHLTIQLSILSTPPITLTLLGARVELDITAGNVTGKLVGGVSRADVDSIVLPALQAQIAAVVQRDCTMLANPPACGCMTDSPGKTYLGLFDVNPKDCAVTLAEISNNSLIVSLLTPDVTVENTMALSLGVGVHVVGATYTTP